MKILLLLAKGFELIEAVTFIDVFGWHSYYGNRNIPIEIKSCGINKEILSTFNIPFKADLLTGEVDAYEYTALAIPGGFGDFGYYQDAYDERFLGIIKAFHRQGKYIASVCVGALPIGRAGILKNRKATTYYLSGTNRIEELAGFDSDFVREPVVLTGNIITSCGPSTASAVALKLLELLTSREEAEKTGAIMGFTEF